MAIDFGKGIATQVVSTGLRKVAGNLPGLLGINKGKTGRNSSDTAPLNERGKASPNLFQFPLDVAGDPGIGNHGHYMLFFINEQKNQKLSFTGKAKDGKEGIVKEKARRKIPTRPRDLHRPKRLRNQPSQRSSSTVSSGKPKTSTTPFHR